ARPGDARPGRARDPGDADVRTLLELPEPRALRVPGADQLRPRSRDHVLALRDQQPELRPRARLACAIVEASVRARVARKRLEQVVRRVDRLVLVGVLVLPAAPTQHPVPGARGELLAPE